MTQLADPIGPPTLTAGSDPAPAELLDLARGLAAEPGLVDRLPAAADERSWLALPVRPGLQAWLIAWPAGTGTGWHDHGDAVGAMVVVAGRLTERSTERPAGHGEGAGLELPAQDGRLRRFAAAEGRSFSARHVHEVANEGSATAYSVHVYHPDLTLMRRYVPSGGRLLPIGTESAGDW
jgi:predicted metal-dependent enzyme (double-stranded beta helix superfamily)